VIVDASQVTPLKGHVAEGTVVRLPDCSTLTIAARMRGWVLVDESGREMGTITSDAQELTRQIVELADA
jgi:hypothetical protein